MIARMFCDFMLLDIKLMKKKPSLLGAVAVFATNMITNRSKSLNNHDSKVVGKNPQDQVQKFKILGSATGGYTEAEIKPLLKHLFYFIKKLELTNVKTMFKKYAQADYLNVVKIIAKIIIPAESKTAIEVNG